MGWSRQDGFVEGMQGRLRTKKGDEERMGSIVHHVVVQALHRRRKLLRVQGGGRNGWTTNESPQNKKRDERSGKG